MGIYQASVHRLWLGVRRKIQRKQALHLRTPLARLAVTWARQTTKVLGTDMMTHYLILFSTRTTSKLMLGGMVTHSGLTVPSLTSHSFQHLAWKRPATRSLKTSSTSMSRHVV